MTIFEHLKEMKTKEPFINKNQELIWAWDPSFGFKKIGVNTYLYISKEDMENTSKVFWLKTLYIMANKLTPNHFPEVRLTLKKKLLMLHAEELNGWEDPLLEDVCLANVLWNKERNVLKKHYHNIIRYCLKQLDLKKPIKWVVETFYLGWPRNNKESIDIRKKFSIDKNFHRTQGNE